MDSGGADGDCADWAVSSFVGWRVRSGALRVVEVWQTESDALLVRNSEYPEDLAAVADAELNVGEFTKARGGIERLAFGEESADCLEALNASSFSRFGVHCGIQVVDDGAIQPAKDEVAIVSSVRVFVARHRLVKFVLELPVILAGVSHGSQTALGGEVQTDSQFDCRAEDRGSQWPVSESPVPCSKRVCLPEIDALSEPVVGFGAIDENVPTQERLSGFLAATVIPKNYWQSVDR